MPVAASCPSCQKKLSLAEELAGRSVRCPGCKTVFAAPAPAAAEAEEQPDEAPRKKKKKTKGAKAAGRGTSGGSRMMILAVASVVGLAIFSLLLFLVPWSTLFVSKPDVELVDVYTAINGLRYHDVGEKALNSGLTALSIPGSRQILVTRPSPQGEYLLAHIKVPYKMVDAQFAQAKVVRVHIYRGMVQIESGGEKVDGIFVQPENDNRGFFQLDYSPPMSHSANAERPRSAQNAPLPKLSDYLGPKGENNWTHPGETARAGDSLGFKGVRGMKVKISVGAERQDGAEGGNPINDLTGHQIFRDRDFLVPNPSGYVHVTWNQGSEGWICDYDLEQPNEIGLNWSMTVIFPKPKAYNNQAKLLVFGKELKVKMP